MVNRGCGVCCKLTRKSGARFRPSTVLTSMHLGLYANHIVMQYMYIHIRACMYRSYDICTCTYINVQVYACAPVYLGMYTCMLFL